MAAKLKVFMTSDGLTEYVVATTSRPKALAAWGSHQDLFKAGSAREADDDPLSDAARARPGEVLRRTAGSRSVLEKAKPSKRARQAPKGPTRAQLKKIADLEASLATADHDHRAALADLEARRAALEAKHAHARARLEAALSAAKRAPG